MKPQPFEDQGATLDQLVDFIPEIRAMAVEAVQHHRPGGLFAPPMLSADDGLQGTIQRPAIGGGANWPGSAVDPETGVLYVPSVNAFSVMKYYTPAPADGTDDVALSRSPDGSLPSCRARGGIGAAGRRLRE
jgi:quinoprotein glucose dehydrogenase